MANTTYPSLAIGDVKEFVGRDIASDRMRSYRYSGDSEERRPNLSRFTGPFIENEDEGEAVDVEFPQYGNKSTRFIRTANPFPTDSRPAGWPSRDHMSYRMSTHETFPNTGQQGRFVRPEVIAFNPMTQDMESGYPRKPYSYEKNPWDTYNADARTSEERWAKQDTSQSRFPLPDFEVVINNNRKNSGGNRRMDSPSPTPRVQQSARNAAFSANANQNYAPFSPLYSNDAYDDQIQGTPVHMDSWSSGPSLSDTEDEHGHVRDYTSDDASETDQLSTYSNDQDFYPQLADSQVDEDLLDPIKWGERISSIESVMKQNYTNRKSWPHTWRHSNPKSCPKVLESVWAEIFNVDSQISQLGLDRPAPFINGKKYHTKQKGSLGEVVDAWMTFQSSSAVGIAPQRPSEKTIRSHRSEDWSSTCHEVSRLLKARDYLILVCHDAETLNGLHPSMKAITWFERLNPKNDSSLERMRPLIIELMSVSFSHLGAIINALNMILQALLWGYSNESHICFVISKDASEIPPRVKVRPGPLQHAFLPKDDQEENGARVIEAYLQSLDLGLILLNTELEVFSAVLNQALLFQCDVHIVSTDSQPIQNVLAGYGRTLVFGFSWEKYPLECMSNFIQGRPVWVLVSPNEEVPVTPSKAKERPKAYLRTTILKLSMIWGPIWQVSDFGDREHWIWYRLPTGYIGQPAEIRIPSLPDESLCHFSTDPKDFGRCPSSRFFVPDTPYLLIGGSLPTRLVERDCQTDMRAGLYGVELQTLGTLKPFKYKDASAIQVGGGYGGVQANWTTQFKTNPGSLAKDSLLRRWKYEPDHRNFNLLKKWYGVQISLCTRNAKRCRLLDLLRSNLMLRYIAVAYKPQDVTCKLALLAALEGDHVNAVFDLYYDNPSWQAEIGTVIARCLDLLKGTGVNPDGNLAAFTFIEGDDDYEHLAIFPKRDHTWIRHLNDSHIMATFAVVTSKCLAYPRLPGQTCRLEDSNSLQSVFQTNYVPVRASNVGSLLQEMVPSSVLKMIDSSKFKINQRAGRADRGILFGTWDPLRYRMIPSLSKEMYRERRQEREESIRVFAVSRKTQTLPRYKSPQVTLVPFTWSSDGPGTRARSKARSNFPNDNSSVKIDSVDNGSVNNGSVNNGSAKDYLFNNSSVG